MSTPTAAATAAAASDKLVNRVRLASFGSLTGLAIQFVLGVSYGLYGTAPTSTKSIGMFSSPLLDAHVSMGFLIIVSAIVLIVRAVQARLTGAIVTSAIGLLAILAAFGAGSDFTKAGSNGASLGMAIATAVAMLCYGTIPVFFLGRPGKGV